MMNSKVKNISDFKTMTTEDMEQTNGGIVVTTGALIGLGLAALGGATGLYFGLK